jgi:hypothetical protein
MELTLPPKQNEIRINQEQLQNLEELELANQESLRSSHYFDSFPNFISEHVKVFSVKN